MSYTNDQWFALGHAGETVLRSLNNGQWNVKADNPPFIYPDRSVRLPGPDGNLVTIPMQRGYIRTLDTAYNNVAVPIRKCQFQFNPQTLQHGVYMSQSERNPFLMSAQDLAEPFPGAINFGFDVMFDRQMELNNPGPPPPGFDPNNPWETGDPSQVGVLRDLHALYEVIGQGVSQANIALAKAINPSANAGTSPLNTDVGNVTYLAPGKYVRVVFSGLYMVEGFVTSTETIFTKFTTSYVPSQVQVRMSMEAKYVGFAKKDTVVTHLIANRVQEELETANEKITQYNDVLMALRASIPNVVIADSVSPATGPSVESKILRHELSFPSAKRSIDTQQTNPTWGVPEEQQQQRSSAGGVPKDAISSLLRDGDLSGISFSTRVTAYGPFSSITPDAGPPSARVVSQQKLAQLTMGPYTAGVSVLGQTNIEPFNGVPSPLMSEMLQQEGASQANDSKSWEDMVKRSAFSTRTVVPSSKGETLVAPKLVILKYEVTVTVRSSSGTITGNGETYGIGEAAAVSNAFRSPTPVAVRWPDEKATIEGAASLSSSPVVPSDNANSYVPKTTPGSTSPVGRTTRSGATPTTRLQFE